MATLPNSKTMDAKTRSRYKVRAQIIKSMAHPTRLFIVDELAKGERCVCELTEMIGADMSTVSKHLSILKQAGVIEDERRGTYVIYKLRIPCILQMFDCVEAVLQETVRKMGVGDLR